MFPALALPLGVGGAEVSDSAIINKKFLTLAEAAEYLTLSQSYLYIIAREGKVPASRVGRRLIFNTQSLDVWMRERETGTAGIPSRTPAPSAGRAVSEARGAL
jgi:excisionase family DNA binding protein